MQWTSVNNGNNRTWAGRIGELLVFTQPLNVQEEAALLAYLRAKWLAKGTASVEPPPFLSGVYPEPVLDEVGLTLADGTALVQAGTTRPLAALAVGDDVAFTRDWASGATGFALFDVLGGMTFGARPALHVVTSPGESAKLFGGTPPTETTDWTVTSDQAQASGVTRRADGLYLSVGGGSIIYIR